MNVEKYMRHAYDNVKAETVTELVAHAIYSSTYGGGQWTYIVDCVHRMAIVWLANVWSDE